MRTFNQRQFPKHAYSEMSKKLKIEHATLHIIEI